ncbi:MAG: ribbon-helix-helix protein, CopG family [Candidatus Bathyarchaeales archaeon]
MNPTRITVAFDPATAALLEKISKETELSQSEVMRRALRFYSENKMLLDPAVKKKVYAYMDLLLSGEHVILDVDHWLLFLNFIESLPDPEKFWIAHKAVAQSHKDQLKSKVRTAEDVLARLEVCNFFRMIKNSEIDYTLVLGSEQPKKFVRILIEEFFAAIGVHAEIKENLAKLNVNIKL